MDNDRELSTEISFIPTLMHSYLKYKIVTVVTIAHPIPSVILELVLNQYKRLIWNWADAVKCYDRGIDNMHGTEYVVGSGRAMIFWKRKTETLMGSRDF